MSINTAQATGRACVVFILNNSISKKDLVMRHFLSIIILIVLSTVKGIGQVDIHGCTDSTALNYNPLATINDGSCMYNSGSDIHGVYGFHRIKLQPSSHS